MKYYLGLTYLSTESYELSKDGSDILDKTYFDFYNSLLLAVEIVLHIGCRNSFNIFFTCFDSASLTSKL